MPAPDIRLEGERSEMCKRLGSLPVVLQMLRNLGVREIVDRYCPIREKVADYSHGQMVEILIANRLTAPHPLYKFDLWTEEFAVAELFQMDPAKLNDDRLGRTLDALSDAIDAVQLEVAAKAVSTYDLSLEQAHLDITSFMFEGAYENDVPEYPQVKRGYNADGDYKRKQIRTGQAVLKDGNVPIFHKVFDGNRTDSNTLMQVFEGLEFMRSMAKPKELVHVGDSKLLSAGNLLFLLQRGILFVGPGERGKKMEEELLQLDPGGWVELPYACESELLKRKKASPEDWNRYWVQEFACSVLDPATGEPLEFRRLIIRSSDEIRATRKNRERQMLKAEEELQKLANGIPRYYKTEQDVYKKADSILESRRVKGLFHVEVGTRDGRSYVEWTRDTKAIEKAERVSGCYPLLTSLPASRTANEVLAIQKDQYRVEHRFDNWKGPLAVCPIFLHSNRRVAALVMVTALALMIFSLIERQVRRELTDDDGYAVGFLPEKRKSRPTGTTILYALRVVTAIIVQGEPRIDRVLNLPPLVQRIHQVFGVDISQITN